MKKVYYAQASLLSDDERSMCCIMREVGGEDFIEEWLPYSPMKHLITNEIREDFYVMPAQIIKIEIDEEPGKINYTFALSDMDEEKEREFFMKPDLFKDMGDLSFMMGEKNDG